METWFTPSHPRKNDRTWSITLVVTVCVVIALYVAVGLESFSLQATKSVTATTFSQENVAKQVLEEGVGEERTETEFGVLEDDGLRFEDSFARDKVCTGRYIYVYDLPPQYNADLVKHCIRDENWRRMCEDASNEGLGEQMMLPENNSLSSILLPHDAWYITSQFALGLLFHERLKRYSCLTDDPEKAVFSYIPFYTALDVSRTIFSANVAARDKLSQRLMGWLQHHKHWEASGGRNHVIVLARIIWDYTRKEDVDDGWGNALLSFPEMQNVTKLSIERAPGSVDQMAIPYPTSFHPYSEEDIRAWQKTLESSERKIFVLFAGAPRNNTLSGSLRSGLMQQCQISSNCSFLSCRKINCMKNPEIITREFLKSVFCLQPPGDSPTRKGVFDCLVAGSIPVFFDQKTAYLQYAWHLPSNASSYSVHFDMEKVANGTIDIMKELQKIPQERIESMQKTVRELVPSIIYRKPGFNVTYKDAFDVTIDNLLEKFREY